MVRLELGLISKRFLNELNEGANTIKLGRLFQILVILIVK